jgi:hypothetical protein
MPTVLRLDGFRFYVFSADWREPAHVHVERGGASVKIWLERAEVARNIGFAPHELAAVIGIVRARRRELLEAWNVYFR